MMGALDKTGKIRIEYCGYHRTLAIRLVTLSLTPEIHPVTQRPHGQSELSIRGIEVAGPSLLFHSTV